MAINKQTHSPETTTSSLWGWVSPMAWGSAAYNLAQKVVPVYLNHLAIGKIEEMVNTNVKEPIVFGIKKTGAYWFRDDPESPSEKTKNDTAERNQALVYEVYKVAKERGVPRGALIEVTEGAAKTGNFSTDLLSPAQKRVVEEAKKRTREICVD